MQAVNSTDDDDEGLSDALNDLDDLGGQFADLNINCAAGWSDADRLVIKACLGLLKTAQASLKKLSKAISVSGRCDSEAAVTELDNYIGQISAISPVVDELVSSLYPPVKLPVVQTMVCTTTVYYRL